MYEYCRSLKILIPHTGCWTDRPMPEQPINTCNADAGNACVVRWREYAHGGRARVAATVVLPVMAATVDEYV